MTNSSTQNTALSGDILGRYTCNGLDEALRDKHYFRPDVWPFDVVCCGSFAGVVAQYLFTADAAHQRGLRLTLPPRTNGVRRVEVWGVLLSGFKGGDEMTII